MKPVSKSELTKQQELFLIASGDFTAEELSATQQDVAKGSLQLGVAEARLSLLCATLSLDHVMGFLGWEEDVVRDAISDDRLYAVAIADRLRFPAWQFNVGSPTKLLPGLTDVIRAVEPRWEWHSVSAFFATAQSSLVTEGRRTPAEWLRDGGDINAVIDLVQADEWW